MQTQEQKKYIGAILFLLPLIFAFGAVYSHYTKYISPDETNRAIFLNPPVTSKVPSKSPDYNVLLPKGYKVFINNTCLVYKGMSDDMIHMELYLLEFDQDIPYSRNFTKESAQDGIWFGNVQYKLVKAKKNTLRLKILRIRKIG